MKYLYSLICGLAAALIPTFSNAQCALYPIDLEERFDRSSLVVEARVISQECFEDASDSHIYTANEIEVLSVLKGEFSGQKATVVTQGGFVGNRGESVHPSLVLQIGNTGLFTLIEGRWEVEGKSTFKAYSGPQGFVSYDLYDHSARDVFNDYGTVEGPFSDMLEDYDGYSRRKQKSIPWAEQGNKSVPSIDSISPLSVRAGTQDVLTIYGSGFGNNQGSGEVEFRNASTGPSAVYPMATEYISWSDTKIEVEVPYRAGTGAIRVIQGGSDIEPGLVIRFAQLALANGNYPIPAVHLDNNGNGGFTWSMAQDFHGVVDGRNSFVRAIENWADHTCINWANGPATNVDNDIQDGVNNIRFADTNELDPGVLANTRNYWTNCNANTAFTTEIDMNYNPEVNWHYGSGFPSIGKYDIESVSVHELGHAHQLGHVINSADIMHATIGPGQQKRGLKDDDIEGGFHVMKASVVKKECGPTEMTGKAGCDIPLSVNEYSIDESSFNAFPNPMSSLLSIQLPEHENGILSIRDMTGRQVEQFYTSGQIKLDWLPESDLSNGLYLITFQAGNKRMSSKVLLSR